MVLASLAIASVAWIGLRLESGSTVSSSGKGEQPTIVPQVASHANVALPGSVEDAPVSPPEQTPAGDALEEALINDLGVKLYGYFNEPFVQFLVARGLSRQDGERVIGEAFHEAAICWFTAVRAQTEAEGKSFDPAFELERGAMANARTVDQLSASCINRALEHVGVNPPLGIRENDA